MGLNMKKTKILSTTSPSEPTQVCIIGFGLVNILSAQDRHKYLGRLFSGDFGMPSKIKIDHRLPCAWMKYKAFQHVFEDQK